MNNKKSLLVSMGFALALLSFGEATFAQANNSDPFAQGALTVTVTGVSNSSDFALSGDVSGQTAFDGQSINGGNLSITENVLTAIAGSDPNIGLDNNSGNFNDSTIFGTDIAVGDNSSSGVSSDNTITRRNSSPDTNSIEAATEAKISPEQIVVCLTDSCSSREGGGGNTISVNDLAKLIADDLNKSLNDLAVAENAESSGEVVIGQPTEDNSRRIARAESPNDRNQITRRNSLENEDCHCVPGENKIVREPSNPDSSNVSQNVKTVAETRQLVKTKLEESSKFIEQMNQLKPENSIW